ncbi:MAG: 3-hydroxyacyl-ACP dehydratase FabZ [Deltaproteobacteria bacterium]|nr:3-hydroxyacyl-ACP dehydratase FabZ [Deltaproteobacteria bacterium]
MDILAIQAVLPHRYPFLLVDRVDELGEQKIVARKMVTADEPFFQGHFPGRPIMPGLLILEALAQAGALLVAPKAGFDPARDAIFLMSVDKAKFRRPVVPGDALLLEVVVLRKGSAVWKMRGRALVDNTVVAEAEFLAGIKRPQAP